MTIVIYSYRNYFKKLNKKYDLTSSCNRARIEAVAPETSALANTTFRSLTREMRETMYKKTTTTLAKKLTNDA